MIQVPYPSRQIAFHQLLVAARKTWLRDALSETLKTVEPRVVKKQLAEFVPGSAQQILAAAGIRDEHVYPVPAVLEAQPTLLGYYRLLLGISQKSFYGSGSGLGRFKTMETRGTLNPKQANDLSSLCTEMAKAFTTLVSQLSPTITKRDVDELPLLTLGSQFQGANNVVIGQLAIVEVFLAISEIVGEQILDRSDVSLSVTNAAGRLVRITLASDPDVRIEEEFGDTVHHKVAIEVKGGTDQSNAHNRAGEAEKSHQKAKGAGFREFWTIIALKGSGRRKTPGRIAYHELLVRRGPCSRPGRVRLERV